MNYKNLAANEKDAEVLSVEDEKIRALLFNLKRVEAPKDFDFRVRARIADASSAQYKNHKNRFLPVLRYVFPLVAVLLISAVLIFNSLYFGGAQNIPTVAENNFQSPVTEKQSIQSVLNAENPTIDNPSSDVKIAATDVPNAAVFPVKNKKAAASEIVAGAAFEKSERKLKTKIVPEENNPADAGGSRISALTVPKQIITPPGINLDNLGGTVKDLPNFPKTKSLTVRDVLSQLGIEAIYTEQNWKVLSVRQNSPAERSGVKTGDVIESIDGEKLTDKPLQGKTIEGKTLTILRANQKIEISPGIKPN